MLTKYGNFIIIFWGKEQYLSLDHGVPLILNNLGNLSKGITFVLSYCSIEETFTIL